MIGISKTVIYRVTQGHGSFERLCFQNAQCEGVEDTLLGSIRANDTAQQKKM